MGVYEFIRRANELYGDKFDYSNVEYVNKDTPIAVICPEHGPFETTPGNHLTSKTGCGQCAGNVRLTISGFIEKAVEVHGDFYDYSNVDYLNTKSDVEIICPEHGPFQQTPGGHLSGRGCLLCANARKPGLYQIEKALAGRYDNLQGYVYVIHAISPSGVECWKVGVGQGTRLVGIRSIMKQAGFNVLSWDRFEMPTMGAAVIVEDAIHKRLSDQRFFPGLRFGGWHELFTRKPHVRRFMRGARYLNYIAGLD